MSALTTVVVVLVVLVLVGLVLSVRIVQQYERGVLFRLGRVVGVREPGLTLIVPVIDVLADDALGLDRPGHDPQRHPAAGDQGANGAPAAGRD